MEFKWNSNVRGIICNTYKIYNNKVEEHIWMDMYLQLSSNLSLHYNYPAYVPTVVSDKRKYEVRVPAPMALAPATNNLSDAIACHVTCRLCRKKN